MLILGYCIATGQSRESAMATRNTFLPIAGELNAIVG
ncbi:hypothetical protein FHY33_003623 [Xanthomonas arboricola]|nr:hypothetical protein [Xanthomonas campestris]